LKLRVLLLLLFFGAICAQAATTRPWPDPWVWILEGEELRARHADTLEEVLREVPGLRVEAFGGPGYPFFASPGLGEGLLLVVDGMPFRDSWSGENLSVEISMSMVEKVEVELRPAVLEFGGEASAGVIRVTTRRNDRPLSRTGIHVSPLMIGEPVSRRFSLETPPGGVALAVSLDEHERDPVLAESGEATGAVESRVLLTRMSLGGGPAGPMEFQLIQSRDHRNLAGAEARSAYRLSLALPEGPAGNWRLRQSFEGRDTEARRLVLSGLELYWSSRTEALESLGINAFAGMEVWRPEIQDFEQERRRLPGQGRAWLSLSKRQALPLGLAGSFGLRMEAPREGEIGLTGELRLGRSLADRPMRAEAFFTGGRQAPPWDRDRLEGLGLWPAGPTFPAEAATADFLRAGISLGAWAERWSWTLGSWTESGETWSLVKPDDEDAVWTLADPGRRSGLSFAGRSEIGFLRRVFDAGFDGLFSFMGADGSRTAGRMTGTLDLQAEMDEREGGAPLRIRAGLDYQRNIAKPAQSPGRRCRGDRRFPAARPRSSHRRGLDLVQLVGNRRWARFFAGGLPCSTSNSSPLANPTGPV